MRWRSRGHDKTITEEHREARRKRATAGESGGWVRILQESIIFPLYCRATREQNFQRVLWTERLPLK